jgi:hypothetical protein
MKIERMDDLPTIFSLPVDDRHKLVGMVNTNLTRTFRPMYRDAHGIWRSYTLNGSEVSYSSYPDGTAVAVRRAINHFKP